MNQAKVVNMKSEGKRDSKIPDNKGKVKMGKVDSNWVQFCKLLPGAQPDELGFCQVALEA